MKVETVVVFRLEEDEAARLNPLLPPVMPGVVFREGTWQVRFHHAPDAVKGLARALVEVDVGFDVREERTFHSDEIERAPALRLHDAPLVRTIVEAEDSGCRHRGRADEGARQVRLAERAATRIAMTDKGQVLVDEGVAAAMIRGHVEGCLLRPVGGPSGAGDAFFEIVPVHRLPPMHSPPARFAKAAEGACKECGVGGFHLVSPAFYDVEVEALTDVNATFESFGETAAPSLLFSQRLWRILKESGVEDLAVEPVLFV
jgi:hypothetical protein